MGTTSALFTAEYGFPPFVAFKSIATRLLSYHRIVEETILHGYVYNKPQLFIGSEFDHCHTRGRRITDPAFQLPRHPQRLLDEHQGHNPNEQII